MGRRSEGRRPFRFWHYKWLQERSCAIIDHAITRRNYGSGSSAASIYSAHWRKKDLYS